jgi:hypothetical protein
MCTGPLAYGSAAVTSHLFGTFFIYKLCFPFFGEPAAGSLFSILLLRQGSLVLHVVSKYSFATGKHFLRGYLYILAGNLAKISNEMAIPKFE